MREGANAYLVTSIDLVLLQELFVLLVKVVFALLVITVVTDLDRLVGKANFLTFLVLRRFLFLLHDLGLLFHGSPRPSLHTCCS